MNPLSLVWEPMAYIEGEVFSIRALSFFLSARLAIANKYSNIKEAEDERLFGNY